jgi:hypothetical protein
MLDAIGDKLIKISSKNHTLFFLGVMIITSAIICIYEYTTTPALMVWPCYCHVSQNEISPLSSYANGFCIVWWEANCAINSTSTNVAVSGYLAHGGHAAAGFL